MIRLINYYIRRNRRNRCNLKKLSKKTDGFRKINGKKLPAKLAPLYNSKVLLNVINSKGERVYITKGIRKKNTRVGIHVHKYGGYTLVLRGEITDFVEGIENKKYKAGSGYYMPPCTPMSACNLGKEDAELIDIFIGKPGEPFIDILEPCWKFPREGILPK
jgi:quercetin dioxygenase-like cupin family protein